MTMGDIIREERLKHKMTMEELGDRLGVGKSAINKWEKGYVQNIKRPMIMKMSEIFGVSPAYLMGIDEYDAPEEFETALRESEDASTPEPDSEGYYLDPESAELAEFAHKNPEYKALFDASRKVIF